MADQRLQYNENVIGANHPTETDTANRLALVDHNDDGTHEKLTVGSDADGDMYYRASSVLARLAKGAADTKLFINAGATAPEWANGMSRVTFTREMDAATGTVDITGAGFKPSAAILIGGVTGTPLTAIGFWTGSNGGGLSNGHNVTADAWYVSTAMAIFRESSTQYQSASISAWLSDGATFSWTRVGVTAAATVTCYVLFFR